MPTIETICVNSTQKIADEKYLIKSVNWSPNTMAAGYPGVICLLTEIDQIFPRKRWKEARHIFIEKLIKSINAEGLFNPSILTGTSGVCAAIDYVCREDSRYNSLHDKLHSQLLKQIKNFYLKPFQKYIEEGTGVPTNFYDAILGLSGLMPYLLDHSHDESTCAVILEILTLLVELTKPITIDGRVLPGWFIPAKFQNQGENYPFGCFDSGLAHGISGVLVALAKASLKRITVEGQENAMIRIISWLQLIRCDIGKFSAVWPARYGLRSDQEEGDEIPIGYRDGWCYGAPGIAFALFIAAHALQDQQLYHYAVDAMKQACNRLNSASTLLCLSFCHGYAGVLTIIQQMFLATKDPLFDTTADSIFSLVQSRYDQNLPFGFKSMIPMGVNNEIEGDSAGLIGGSTGILLSLLFRQSSRPRPWQQIFLVG